MVKANFTLEQLRAAPHLSYSALNTYLNICQLQFFFRYVAKLEPEQTPVALPFGSAFHAALSEQAQAAKQGEKLSVAQLTDAFATYFTASCNGSDNVVFKREESKDDMILLAAKMLDAALSDWRDYWNVDAVALPFQIEMPGIDIPLIGEIDMLVSESNPFDDDPETPCIVDFKTAARMWPDDKAGKDLQATVFSYAFEKIYRRKPMFRFDVITKTKNPAVKRFYTERQQNDYNRLEKLVQAAQSAIQAGVFLPNETSFACGDCPYAGSCAQWHCSAKPTAVRREVAA